MNTALEYSTRVVQEGVRRCKKSTLNDLVHMTPLRIPLRNPPTHSLAGSVTTNVKTTVHCSPEPVIFNVYGAQEPIPRNEFRQPM
jgi:hypothetical protein